MTPPGTQWRVIQEVINKQTLLYTRFGTGLKGPAEVAYLEDALGVTMLFEEVKTVWKSKITGAVKLAVTFPWLSQNSTISVREDRPRSHEMMLEEINRASCWKKGSRAACVVNGQVSLE